ATSALNSSGIRSSVTLPPDPSWCVRKCRCRNCRSGSACHSRSRSGFTERTGVGWCRWYSSDDGPVKPLLPTSSSAYSPPSGRRKTLCRLRGICPSWWYRGMVAPRLQVAPQRLLALDGLEEGPEVPLAETAAALPLDQLEEQRRTVLHRAREQLQQVALLVAVDEDAELADEVERLLDLADALRQQLVVAARHAEELHAVVAQPLHGVQDVGRLERDVLDARAAIVLQVFVDLALAAPRRRLV